ncbi:MAG TPA: glutamate-5-semialdehyde dehydrogenase [Opitutae bacterium]|nr:glutamate-5-semialdehyde dehydrogenase [Opitutaceae bacterium]HCR28961.1 glutamate-5-semialdehyde dehydrogenase [Opitutae bacterium]
MTTEAIDTESLINQIASDAREASLVLANSPTEQKNTAILKLAKLIEQNVYKLKAENAKDLSAAGENGITPAMLKRLELSDRMVSDMLAGARQVAELPDPLGESLETYDHPQGFSIEKVRVPIGVIGIIYESRPNVTVDCAILCLKSGNASILRGGKEAYHTNIALAKLVTQALEESGLPPKASQFIPTKDRSALNTLLKLDDKVQCIIPRGGEGLIRFVAEHSHIPVIKHFDGICNLYADKELDIAQAKELIVNAKCQKPSVCNAAENLLIHRDIANKALPEIAKALIGEGVELRTDPQGKAILDTCDIESEIAQDDDWGTEYLDLIISIKIVDSTEEAIAFINSYGSSHSDCILTTDKEAAEKFLNGVDSATVYWNVSTRFTDGFEFGLGAEIGISTDKLHARGPMGLRELCSYKFKIVGDGQIKT